MRKIEVDSVPEFELGDTGEEVGKGGKREGRHSNRGRSGGITLTRGGSCRKKAQDRKK